MQSTGQTSTHELSFVPMHGSAMTYVTPWTIRSAGRFRLRVFERRAQGRLRLARRHVADGDRVATDPLGGLAQRRRHPLDLARLERDLLGVERAAVALGVDAPDETAAGEQRHRVVAVGPLGLRDVRLDEV